MMDLKELSDVTIKQEHAEKSMHKAKAIAMKVICDMYHSIQDDKDHEVTSEEIDMIKDAVAILSIK